MSLASPSKLIAALLLLACAACSGGVAPAGAGGDANKTNDSTAADSGTASDPGTDAGTSSDSGTATDPGPATDGGTTTTDPAPATDGGGSTDAGTPVDGGASTDGGSTPVDSGGSTDAGSTGGSTDAGTGTGGGTGSTDAGPLTPTVQALYVSPLDAAIAAGTAQQYTAVALYTDGVRKDVTAAATWTTSSDAVAARWAAAQFGGISAGEATISVAFEGAVASTSLTIKPATLASIEISPRGASIAKGTSLALTATGLFSDKSVQDVTAQVAWSASAGVAFSGAPGAARGEAVGSSTVTAELFGVTATTTLAVTDAVLASIEISPASGKIAAGTGLQLGAVGVFSDGSVADLTSQVGWTASSAAVELSASGYAVAKGAGSATITAALGDVSSSAPLEVTAATLVSLAVEPVQLSLAKGTAASLTAVGTFSDGSEQQLTAQVAWASSDDTVVAVSNGAGSEGEARGLAGGTATVTASLFGATGAAQVAVKDTDILSIDITPSPAQVPVGWWTQLRAVASFKDGSTQDVTGHAVWTSSDGSVATVSNATGNAGVVTGVSTGTATLTVAFLGVEGGASLGVFSSKLTSVAIAPASIELAVGQTAKLQATGTFANGFSMDVTAQVRWSSSAKAVVQANNKARGTIVALAAGTANVSAARGGKSGSAAVTVR